MVSPLKTKSGAEFREWSISRIEGNKAIIQHADGSTSIQIADILSETLWQDPVVKKAINEGTEKEAKGDMQAALAIYAQFGLKEAISRVAEKLAHEKEANGDLKEARDFYSQINSGKDVARLTVQIDEQEQKMRAETAVRQKEQAQMARIKAEEAERFRALEALLHRVKVIQVHKDGVIAIVIAGPNRKLNSLIFIAGIQREVVDDEIWAGPLVEAGTYKYETLNGAAKTIRSYRVFEK